MSGSRKLVGIMFSDIEGYTSMMEKDEQNGRMISKRYRKVLDEKLSLFNGTLINAYGDGSLCIFNSIIQAVQCALAIQHQLVKDPVVPLRIGLHLGDIVIDGMDVYGSGINIASRIESMGVSGSILISASVYKEIKNQSDFDLISMGHFDFKNVDLPIEVFALQNKGLVVPDPAALVGKFKEKGSKKNPFNYIIGVLLLFIFGYLAITNQPASGTQINTMAILPLKPLTDMVDQEILSEGLHEGLVSSLGQLKPVRIISKGSTLKFANTDKTLKEIGNELNADGIVSGGFSLDGDVVQLILRLVKTVPKEKELWTHTYTGQLNEIINIFQNAREDIARKINAHLTMADNSSQIVKTSINPDTYKAFLRGKYFLNKSTPEDFQKGMKYLMEAVEQDPADPRAYTGLAQGYAMLGHGPDPEDQVWRRGRAAALQAIKLDSTIAEAHTVLGVIKCYYEWDWEGAEKEYLKALEINPNHAFAHFQYAWYLIIFGRYEEAIEHHLLAKELDPLTPIFTVDMGSLYLWVGEVDKAIEEVNEGLELDQEFAHGWWVLGNVYMAKGMYEKALEAHRHAASIHPIWRGALGGTYALSGQPEKARIILEEFKNKTISPRSAFWIAYMHFALGEYEEMYKWLNYEFPDPWLVVIRTWPEYRILHGDPRFKAFIKRLGQPPI